MNYAEMNYHNLSEELKDFAIAKFCDGVSLKGRVGTWHGIDLVRVSNKAETANFAVCLFEHDTYGDMAGLILAFYDRYSEQWIELCETWDDIVQTMIDECII